MAGPDAVAIGPCVAPTVVTAMITTYTAAADQNNTWLLVRFPALNELSV
jgi:hypothetical protein